MDLEQKILEYLRCNPAPRSLSIIVRALSSDWVETSMSLERLSKESNVLKCSGLFRYYVFSEDRFRRILQVLSEEIKIGEMQDVRRLYEAHRDAFVEEDIQSYHRFRHLSVYQVQ